MTNKDFNREIKCVEILGSGIKEYPKCILREFLEDFRKEKISFKFVNDNIIIAKDIISGDNILKIELL